MKRLVSGKEIKEVLMTEGRIITWNNESALKEPRYYRYNSKLNVVEYSDDKINWKESRKHIDSFNEEWIVIE